MTGVILGAMGAHALDNILPPERKSSWELGGQYQLVHGLGLIIVALLYEKIGSLLISISGGLMFIGVWLFSGSIYQNSIGAAPGINAIAPYGGMSFMLAWLLLAIAVIRAPR